VTENRFYGIVVDHDSRSTAAAEIRSFRDGGDDALSPDGRGQAGWSNRGEERLSALLPPLMVRDRTWDHSCRHEPFRRRSHTRAGPLI